MINRQSQTPPTDPLARCSLYSVLKQIFGNKIRTISNILNSSIFLPKQNKNQNIDTNRYLVFMNFCQKVGNDHVSTLKPLQTTSVLETLHPAVCANLGFLDYYQSMDCLLDLQNIFYRCRIDVVHVQFFKMFIKTTENYISN